LQAQEDVSKNLVLIKNMLYGTSDAEPQTDIIVAQLAQELYNSTLLLLLIQNLARIDFEVSCTIQMRVFIVYNIGLLL
jgi:calcium binding protein 39